MILWGYQLPATFLISLLTKFSEPEVQVPSRASNPVFVIAR